MKNDITFNFHLPTYVRVERCLKTVFMEPFGSSHFGGIKIYLIN
jgi:hypothetical protein